MSQVVIQNHNENNAEYYTGALRSVTYSAVGGAKGISKKREKDLINIIDDALSDGSIELFKETIDTFGIDPFDAKYLNNLIVSRQEGGSEEKELDVFSSLKKNNYVVILEKNESRPVYYVKDTVRSGKYNAFKIFRKEGEDSITKFAISEAVGTDIIVSRNVDTVPSAITIFNPAQESIYKECKETYFNMWTSPALACLEKDADVMYEPELYHLLDTLLMNLVGYDRDAYTYLMNVLAKSYQTKNYMTNIIILTGTQGTGKQILTNILRDIYTPDHVGVGGVKHNIFSDSDNSMLRDKLVYVLDEVAIGNEFYEDAKTMAGNAYFTLKSLNKNAIEYPNRALFLNFFNLSREDAIGFPIAQGDRRVSVMAGWSPLIKAEYFKDYSNLDDAIHNFRRESGSGLVEYFAWQLATLEVDEDLIKVPYDNDIRRRWMEETQDNTEDFYTAILSADITYFENKADGIIYDGFGVTDTMIKMFSGEFELRVTRLSNIFEAMFGEKENKKVRDRVMFGKKTRTDGDRGSFVYKIDSLSTMSPTRMAIANTISIPKPVNGYAYV